MDLVQDYTPCGAILGGCSPHQRSVEVEDQGMDLDLDQDEYLEVEDNYTNEDYSTTTPDQHRDENIGQEQDTMTMESGLNRRSSLCSLCSKSRCLKVFGIRC